MSKERTQVIKAPWEDRQADLKALQSEQPPSLSSTKQQNYQRVESFHLVTPHENSNSFPYKKSEKLTNEEKYEINFNNADIQSVINTILGEMLKLEFIISPKIKGKVTFRTNKPVSKSSMLSALEVILASHSAVLIKNRTTYSIIPASESAKRIHAVESGASRAPGFAYELVPLRYIDADEMAKILKSFIPKSKLLQANKHNNHIIIAGNSQERNSILDIILHYDKDWLSGMKFSIYHLQEGRARTIVNELKNIFKGPQDLFLERVRLVTLERANSIIAMSKNADDLNIVTQWVTRLDVTNERTQDVHLYNVKYGNAKSLVDILDQALHMGPQEQEQADNKSELNSSAQATGFRLVAIEENNSILFYGKAHEYELIKTFLSKIDTPVRQVMIEAILAEVTLNDSLRYGVQWFFESGDGTVTLSTNESGSVLPQSPGFSYLYNGSSNARVVIDALRSKTDVRILSAPKLSVLNNKTAKLQVGDQVPTIVQTSQSSDAADAPLISTVQMRDTGVILEITPQINSNGHVVLDVVQEVSEVAETVTSGIDSPTIQQRKVHTTISTRDGFTVALGGLIRESGGDSTNGVPLIQDIPVLGNLFKSTSIKNRRTELIILLVPHVMHDQSDTQSVVDSLITGLQSANDVAKNALPFTSP